MESQVSSLKSQICEREKKKKKKKKERFKGLFGKVV